MDEPMDKIVSAAEANRRFSQLLRSVREGDSYVVTAHGKPVARIVPPDRDDTMMERSRALLFARLRSQPALNAGRWTRDELYDDEP
jgi:prevent-host-death family protein